MTAAFRQASYAIGNGTSLAPLPPDAAAELGAGFAAIDPWKRLGFAPGRMTLFFSSRDGGSVRFAIRHGDAIAGFVCVDPNWLCGPYLHFLGVLPAFQGHGIGSGVVAWFLKEARDAGTRNAWVCVSNFNLGARALYARHGFAEAATLADLIDDGVDEVLMRKLVFASGNGLAGDKK